MGKVRLYKNLGELFLRLGSGYVRYEGNNFLSDGKWMFLFFFLRRFNSLKSVSFFLYF